MKQIKTEAITVSAFAPFGDILEARGAHDALINQDKCKRFHDRAALDFSTGRAGVSVFQAEPRHLPYEFNLVERHPMGSQCFVPMHEHPFLVIVAEDADGVPKTPRAFLTEGGQAINFHRGTWHGVLTPLHAPGLFTVIDRIGDGDNLEEYTYDQSFVVIEG